MCKLPFIIVTLSVVYLGEVNSIYYDTYRGVKITKTEYQEYVRVNTTFWCTADVKPCDPKEGRRIDGSCNHLDQPLSGYIHRPLRRLLPPLKDKDNKPVDFEYSEERPLPRYARTQALSTSKLPSLVFTQLVSYFILHIITDTVSIHDSINYLVWRPYCCEPRGRSDDMCRPNYIPDDDLTYSLTNIRCMNMTRPLTLQDVGCAPKNTFPSRVLSDTPLIDLSIIYGESPEIIKKYRTYKNGLLRVEIDSQGRIWPPNKTDQKEIQSVCRLNQGSTETRCYDVPKDGNNGLLGSSLFLVWNWRHHNSIAKRLAKINPCWDDEKVFCTARDINIAYNLQLFYYELLPPLLGKQKIIKEGLISSDPGFRDLYNSSTAPELSVEYAQAMRWFHLIQEAGVNLYDEKGYYLKQLPMVNYTRRTGLVDKTIEYITQGAFRQRGGNHADRMIHPDMAERIFGPNQLASDVATSDLHKNRLTFLPPYVKYLEQCCRKKVKTFQDLKGFIDPERIELLRSLYKYVDRIDLTMGTWMESVISGGYIPPTIYCIVVEQWMRNIAADRHWYERKDRPNAYTSQQLAEIRKATIAGFLCDVGDKVTEIQPKAFLIAGNRNKITSCKKIKNVNYNAWKDPSCDSKSSY